MSPESADSTLVRADDASVGYGSTDIFMPLPRRKSYRAEGPIVDAPKRANSGPTRTKPKPYHIWGRYWRYGTSLVRFVGGNTMDRLHGRGTIERRALRLRVIVQSLGPGSIKIGQQLGTRTDILPREYCDELNRLLDQVDPIPLQDTVKVLEQEWGRPLHEILSAFDPEPIGSGSIASVYQAHLRDGTKVALKVRRPNVDRVLQADFVVLRSLTTWLERFSLIRGGRSKPVLDEMEQMLGDELDFVLESRQTALFRREAKETRYVTAPRIYSELCTTKVMVSEFVDGISMNEIINAVQKRNRALLGELEAMGYNFKRISRRLLRVFFWQTFEASIFHADLHPANIFITPENKFVMVDFGCCGTLSNRYRHALVGFMRSMTASDVTSAADYMIMMNEPLPRLDLDHYKFEMERVIRKFMIMNRSKDAPWYEKCWGGAMKEFIDLARRFNIPMRAELLRYSRANSHLDFMVYRLYPKADPQREFMAWYADRAKRSRAKFGKSIARQVSTVFDAASVGFGDFGQMSFQLISRLRSFLDHRTIGFSSVLGKVAFTCATGIKLVLQLGMLLVLALALRLGVAAYHGAGLAITRATIAEVARHPALLVVAAGLVLLSLRKILVHVLDPEVK